MIALIKTLQVILALSLLIIFHEFGHFLFARIFGIRVDKFYLFFDVGGKALLRLRIGETEFGIGWLPFGGYCKIAGMIDESMDTDQLKKDPQPWEFRSHPAWQRLLVMAGGVLFNFIGAVIIFSCILGIWGKSYLSNEGAAIYAEPLAVEMGFRTGDHIAALDGSAPEDFGSIQSDIVRREVAYVTVLRGSDSLNLYIDHSFAERMLSERMFDLAVPFTVDSLASGSANLRSGLKPGDRICAIAGKRVIYLQDALPILDTLRGRPVCATVIRGADTLSLPLQVDSSARIGVSLKLPQLRSREYSFLEAVPAGFALTGETVGGYLSDLKMLFKPSTGAYKSVGSFIAIGQIFPSSWDWYQFLYILAVLSVMLGVMNLLPIPALDGGHILFTLYEMISGRKPGDRFLMTAQIIGMVLLVMLMMLAFGNDIGRLL